MKSLSYYSQFMDAIAEHQMATRSRIAIQLGEDEFLHVYCHYDGSPRGYDECVGQTLVRHYTTRDKVLDLIRYGHLSCLSPEIHPKGKHTFASPESGVCVFYGRDRSENGTEPEFSNSANFLKDASGAGVEYIYLMRLDGDWVYCKVDEDFRPGMPAFSFPNSVFFWEKLRVE